MAVVWSNLLVPAVVAALAIGACYLVVNYTEFGARQAAKYDDMRKVYALVGVVAAVAAYFFAPSGTTRRLTEATALANPFSEDVDSRDAFDAGAQAQARSQALAAAESAGVETADAYQEPVLDEPFEA